MDGCSPLSGFAFTGEQRDTTGLQYHRARYYNSALGIFPSLDPFEGISARPMSLNGYSWVEGNVVNATDASGMIPENANEVGFGKAYLYSCKCGWLDMSHIGEGISKGDTIFRALRHSINYPSSTLHNLRVVRLQIDSGPGGIVNLDRTYVVPNTILSGISRINSIALGIFQDFWNTWESWNDPWGRFSEEDLPSYLLGFWLSSHSEPNKIRDWLKNYYKADGGERGYFQSSIATELENTCGIPKRSDGTIDEFFQQQIYDAYVGQFGYTDLWSKRSHIPVAARPTVFARCPNNQWPAELESLSAEPHAPIQNASWETVHRLYPANWYTTNFSVRHELLPVTEALEQYPLQNGNISDVAEGLYLIKTISSSSRFSGIGSC